MMAAWKRTGSEFGEADAVAELAKGKLAGLVEQWLSWWRWRVSLLVLSERVCVARLDERSSHGRDGMDCLPSLACVKGPPVARLRTRPAAPPALDPARSGTPPECCSRHRTGRARPIRAARPARRRRVCHPSARLRLPPVIPPPPRFASYREPGPPHSLASLTSARPCVGIRSFGPSERRLPVCDSFGPAAGFSARPASFPRPSRPLCRPASPVLSLRSVRAWVFPYPRLICRPSEPLCASHTPRTSRPPVVRSRGDMAPPPRLGGTGRQFLLEVVGMWVDIPEDGLELRCAKCGQDWATGVVTVEATGTRVPVCDGCMPALPVRAA